VEHGGSLSYELAHDEDFLSGQLVNVRSKIVGVSCRAVFEKRDYVLLHVVGVSVIPLKGNHSPSYQSVRWDHS